jgi:hypothetical protein
MSASPRSRALTTRRGRDSNRGIENPADRLENVDDKTVEVHSIDESRRIGDPKILWILVIKVNVPRKEQTANAPDR